MFGSISFALFPVMIFGITFMGSFLVPLLSATIPAGDLALLAHAMFLLLGFMVGGFGLLGNEMMNRRFGQASLLVYSARSLPLSERFIFANFVLKDIVYYFFLWVFPFGIGYIAASLFWVCPSREGLLLLLTLSLAFLLGLCVVFILSSLYVRSRAACILVVICSAVVLAVYSVLSGTNPALLFPPYLLYTEFSWFAFVGTVIAIAVLFAVSSSSSPQNRRVPPRHTERAREPREVALLPPQIALGGKRSARPLTQRNRNRPGSLLLPDTPHRYLVLPLASPEFPPSSWIDRLIQPHIGHHRLDYLHVGDGVRFVRTLRMSSRFGQHSHLQQDDHLPDLADPPRSVHRGDHGTRRQPGYGSAGHRSLPLDLDLLGLHDGFPLRALPERARLRRAGALHLSSPRWIGTRPFAAISFVDFLYGLSSVLLLVPAYLFVRAAGDRWDAREPAGS